MTAQDFKTPILELEKKELMSAWNKSSVPFETDDGIKGKIMRVDGEVMTIVPALIPGPVSMRIQIPGNVYEIQGVVQGGETLIAEKFFKVNRREAFRLNIERSQKAQVSFNLNRLGIIASIDDISLEGLGFSGAQALSTLKSGDIIKNVKITLETKELDVDLEVRRVFQKDSKILVGGRFTKIHTGGGAGMIVNYINVSLYNRKKLE